MVYFDELEHIVRNGCLGQAFEILEDVDGLQANGHGRVKRVRGELVLVDEFGPGHGLGDRDEEVVRVLVDRREGLDEYVAIGRLKQQHIFSLYLVRLFRFIYCLYNNVY